jgi:sec-independent protein translocase protein TatA
MEFYTLAFLQNLNTPEIIMIGGVILLFFGAKRMPELFHSLGKSVREFKNATSNIEDDFRSAMDVDPVAEARAKAKAEARAELIEEAKAEARAEAKAEVLAELKATKATEAAKKD